MSGEYRCECCGLDLENERALWLEDATLCYPCAIELGYFERSASAGDEYRLYEMYKLREIKARAKRLNQKLSGDTSVFIWANEPSVGLLLTDGDNGELVVQIVKSNGSTHTPIATATIEPYRRLRVCNFAAGAGGAA